MSRWLLSLAACGVALPAFAQLSPEQTVKSMTVAPGLQVELFAAEPMLVNPTSIDVDHRGRVWVCEAVNYRRINFGRPILRPEGDRIVILEDTKGTGHADKSTVFYQGKDLIAPIGIAVAAYPIKANPDRKVGGGSRFGYKVFVCQSPDILLFEDKDGDGKADGPPKKFLTGFRGFDHDHGVHGINIGPDGKLYFTVGDQGVDGLQSSDGKGRKWKSNNTDCRAGTVWRCDMDGTNLELIAHNFRNNYECCVNSFGEIWCSDNDDDGTQQTRICYVMPGGNYGYNPRGPGQSHWHEEQPGIVHKVLRTGFGSPTGICFYEGTLLPEKYRGQLLHTDAGPREFRCFHIKPKGAGYELEKENLVTSTDTWFRLSDVCVAPDGSVMLADWYDPGVGGHGMGDWTRGRIYRVTPKGHKGYKVPEVKFVTNEDKLAALSSPCQATRSLAIRSLGTFNKEERTDFLLFAASPKQSALIRARGAWATVSFMEGGRRDLGGDSLGELFDTLSALFQPQATPGSVPELLSTMCMRAGLMVSGPILEEVPEPRNPKEREMIEKAVKIHAEAPSAAFRREAILNLQYSHPSFVKRSFFALAKGYDGQDIFYRAALNIACGTDPKRREAILADFDKHFPEWNDKVADLVWELRPASSLPRLGKLLKDPKLSVAQKGRIIDILAVYDYADAGKIMLKLLATNAPLEIKSRVIENLRVYLPTKWAGLKKGDEIRDAISGLLKSKDGQIAGLHLAAAAPDCTQIEDVETIAKNAAISRETRTEAVRVIGKLRHVKYFHTLEAMIHDPVIGPAAVTAIGEYAGGKGVNSGGKESLELLRKLITDGQATPELRNAALNALVGSRQGSALLLQLKEKNEMPATLVADAGRLLRNSPFAGERNKAMLLFPAPGKLDPKKLPAPAVLAKRAGNAARGEAIFKASAKSEAQCLRCHTVRGVGGNIGPDLSMIGKKASKENLYDSILTPSKAIADQYLQWKINTLDGKSVIGLLVAENDKEITLRDANGKDYTFAQKDLDGPKQKSLVSIMPDNLVLALTEDELIDVVEYLLTLKTASLSPAVWHILGPFANDASDSALDTDLGLEKLKAINLTETLKGKDGIVKWGTVKTTAAGYVDLMAHHGAKSPMSASYLYRTIESPVEQVGTILFGNDDGAKIWINGTQVFENRDHFAATPARHKIPVKLKKGENTMLIKIVNGNDPHGFYFALTSDQELKLAK